MPFGQRVVSRAVVVRPQDLADQYEELSQTTFIEGLRNGEFPLPFAETFRLDMWVSDVVIAGRGIRLKRNDLIGLELPEMPELQPDLKRSEVHSLQYDPFCLDGDLFLIPVQFDLLELVEQELQFVIEETKIGDGNGIFMWRQFRRQGQTVLAQPVQDLLQLLLASFRRRMVPVPIGQECLVLKFPGLVPMVQRQVTLDLRRRALLIVLFQKPGHSQ